MIGRRETARSGAFQQECILKSGIHHGDRFSRKSKIRLAAITIQTLLQPDLFSPRSRWTAWGNRFRPAEATKRRGGGIGRRFGAVSIGEPEFSEIPLREQAASWRISPDPPSIQGVFIQPRRGRQRL
ncbi:hypothetical protein RB8599 [Rhodopirellula baltica SH 1]|uniref:Uncharacterized protein n=1 Tax=Rhodopirellula baltica (strain DSM 10527 / NCIMB 13988 / SH1) TaxID=243090 RepID=Q7UMT3_RHOBA|nr:hypothetical protein RB8599 [Rhodopirellula baltica SH 1]